MTTDTLEKVARAIHERRSIWPWESANTDEKSVSIGDARAALEAIRFPDNALAWKAALHLCEEGEPYSPAPNLVFTAVIEAILMDAAS